MKRGIRWNGSWKLKQPKLKIERTAVDHLLEVTAFLVALVPLVYLAWVWDALPAMVPTHINGAGLVDAWGSRNEVWILPSVVMGEFILISVLQRFPHTFNYLVKITEENAETQYRIAISMMGWMNLILTTGLSLTFFGVLQISLGVADNLSIWVMPAFMTSLFGSMGYFLWLSWMNR